MQTVFPPSLDSSPVAFRAARYVSFDKSSLTPRFSPTHISPPTIHAILNATKVVKRGAPRKAYVCNFGLVNSPPTVAEKNGSPSESGKGKAKQDLGRWDVLLRREIAGKPVTVLDIRFVLWMGHVR